jgi:CRP-like cAMP-binding protein
MARRSSPKLPLTSRPPRFPTNRPPPATVRSVLATNRTSPATARSLLASNRPAPAAVRNLLLAALPRIDRDRLVPALDVVPLKLKDLLHKPGECIEHVYFPGGGFCSIVTVLEDGRMVEVATVGREGMVGATAALDGNPAWSATMVQGETDTCYCMSADAFRREMDRRGAFYELLTRYSQALVGVIMQSTACNAVHTVEQRLARWLLMAYDRMGSEEFPLTQEFVAMMLGANRPTVTVVAGTLQKAGLITYHRGRVTILDRENLEAASCECYRAATNLLQGVTSARSRAQGSR